MFKKNRTARVSIDYRQLKKVTRKNSYPLCDIQTIFDCLHGSASYASLFVSGSYQVEGDKNEQDRTVFLVPGGDQCVFQLMPFGLCNALATFSRVVNTIFKDVKM